MKFGFIIPHNWGLEDPQDVLNLAVRAEQLGFDSVWVNHHVLNAGYILDRLGGRPYYDSLTTLTYAAALTRGVRLGTTVLVLPYLNSIVLAKSLATLDVFSGGRLTVGIGVGGLPHEAESLGSDYERRGDYSDESIAIMKALWTMEDPAFSGEFYSFSGVKFSPKPAQKPHPPVLIGGHSNPALRRAARLGEGWHPNGLSPDHLASCIEYMKSHLDKAGRSLSDVIICGRYELDVLDSAPSEQPGPMRGAPDQLLRSIESLEKLGMSEIVLSISTRDASRIARVMEAFAERVMPGAR
ncbi:MAG: LLM class flavin-dependent oxidoreductase [Chloroflexi bacterium]|nr:LLM class flavin-dependent oxidoreductase [Chloroflexota bacterium]